MASIELPEDPYAAPKPQRDKTGLMVRTAVMAVIVGGLAFTGYLMSNTQPQPQQLASLETQPGVDEPAAASPADLAPIVDDTATAPAPLAARTTPPAQAAPAEPMIANTPPALPAAADPAVAIPEIQPSSPAG